MFDLTRDVRLSPSSLVRHVNENWFDSPFFISPFSERNDLPLYHFVGSFHVCWLKICYTCYKISYWCLNWCQDVLKN